jgi:hypothetical protein
MDGIFTTPIISANWDLIITGSGADSVIGDFKKDGSKKSS